MIATATSWKIDSGVSLLVLAIGTSRNELDPGEGEKNLHWSLPQSLADCPSLWWLPEHYCWAPINTVN